MIALSHFGINVTDLDRMADFYTRVLGLLVSDRGPLEGGPTLCFLSRDPDEHHQLVLVSGRPPGGGYNVVNQISFKLPTLAELQAMYRRVRDEGIKEFRIATILRPAVRHRGARRRDPRGHGSHLPQSPRIHLARRLAEGPGRPHRRRQLTPRLRSDP